MQAQYNQLQSQYTQAMQQAQQQDPYTKILGEQATDIATWAKGGDYSNLPKGVFASYVDPAIHKRQRDLMSNAGAQGISALATPNSNLLALNKQNLDDEWGRDTAQNYQGQVTNTVNAARGILGGLGSQETEKRFNILNSLGGQTSQANSNMINYQAKLASQPSGWSKFFSGLASGAIGALSSGAI